METYLDTDSMLPPITLDSATSEDLVQLRTTLTAFLDTSKIQFITGDLSLDSDWDSYVAGVEDIGLTRYLEIYQNAIFG